MPVLFKSGNGPVASIVNAYSAGGVSTGSMDAVPSLSVSEVTAGSAYSATPGTLQTVITHTGRGRVNLLTVYTKNATARTLRLKLTIDGTVAFDATSNSISASNNGMAIVGAYSTTFVVFQPIDYQESLLVEVASSVGSDAAANIALGVNRETWAS